MKRVWANNELYKLYQDLDNFVYSKGDKVILTGGYFNPLTAGHIDLFEECKEYGNVVVVINSDEESIKKSGYSFMPLWQREKIVSSLKDVYCCISNFNPTVENAIRILRPNFYGKGGDINEFNLNEKERIACDNVGCRTIFEMGKKITSSSNLLRGYREYVTGIPEGDTI